MLSSSSVEQHNVTSTSELSAVTSEAESAAWNVHATTKVLGTDELLLLILESVPVHDRLPLLQVSKKWNSIASSIGYSVSPVASAMIVCRFSKSPKRNSIASSIGYSVSLVATGIDMCDQSTYIPVSGVAAPRYVISGTIRIDPAIDSVASDKFVFDRVKLRTEAIRYGNKLLRHMGVTVALDSIHDPSKLRSKRHEFITSPPTTMVMLGLRTQFSGLPQDLERDISVAILRESTGIRIGHLLDSFAKMHAFAQHMYGRRPGPAACFAMHQPVASFHYSGQGVVTYLKGSETHSKKLLASFLYDSESDTQDID